MVEPTQDTRNPADGARPVRAQRCPMSLQHRPRRYHRRHNHDGAFRRHIRAESSATEPQSARYPNAQGDPDASGRAPPMKPTVSDSAAAPRFPPMGEEPIDVAWYQIVEGHRQAMRPPHEGTASACCCRVAPSGRSGVPCSPLPGGPDRRPTGISHPSGAGDVTGRHVHSPGTDTWFPRSLHGPP